MLRVQTFPIRHSLNSSLTKGMSAKFPRGGGSNRPSGQPPTYSVHILRMLSIKRRHFTAMRGKLDGLSSRNSVHLNVSPILTPSDTIAAQKPVRCTSVKLLTW